jgi:Uncharacterised nucleotidyltransferase
LSSWRSSAPEAVLVREAMLALGRDRPSLHEAVRRVIRWDRVLALARGHAVAESVWAALSLRGSREAVPAEARAELEGDHAGATARNALLLVEAASFQAALRAEGIESVLLKGPALLAAHYPALGARHVGDVDLLVRRAEVERAAEVARRSGAREWAHTVGQEGADALADCDHHLATMQTAQGVTLELHHLVPGGDEAGADVEGVFERSRIVSWQGRELRIPSAADLAGIACLHVFDHHFGDARFLPRQLADLSVLVGAGATTWEAVEVLYGAEHGPALRASRALLERPAALAPLLFSLVLARERFDQFRALLEKRWSGSPRSALRVFFPARRFMAARYGVPEDSRWMPLLYLWRPARGAFRILTGR